MKVRRTQKTTERIMNNLRKKLTSNTLAQQDPRIKAASMFFRKLNNFRKNIFQRKLGLIFFKTRRGEYFEKNHLDKLREIERQQKPYDVKKAYLEINTIAKLREMYSNTYKYLNNVEAIKNGGRLSKRNLFKPSMTFPLEPPSAVLSYLDKYKEKIELFKRGEKDKITNSKTQKNEKKKELHDAIVSYFKTDEDDLFTINELKQIEQLKYNKIFKKRSRENLDLKVNEVLECHKFTKKFHLPQGKDDYEMRTTNDERITKSDPEKTMRNHLIKWFDRESQPSTNLNYPSQFHYYGSITSKNYMFKNNKDRLKAAVKFLRLAKIIYPELDDIKILSSLQLYTGPASSNLLKRQMKPTKTSLPKMKKKLRYFRKVLHETRELEKMFGTHDTEEVSTFQMITPEMKKKQLEKNFNDIFELNKRWMPLYDEYTESDLPAPFDELFMRTAIGLTKYEVYINNHPLGKWYKGEVSILIETLLNQTLYFFRWFVNSLFRNHSCSKPLKMKVEQDLTTDDTGENIMINKEEHNPVIKKLIAHFIKYMNVIRLIRMTNFDKTSQ